MTTDPNNRSEREAFEARFPMPPDCIWTGGGYAQTRNDAWRAQGYVYMWEGWTARAARPTSAKALTDDLLVQLFYAAQGDITQFRIKARALLEATK